MNGTTLDLIDLRIRAAVTRGNMTPETRGRIQTVFKPSPDLAHVDTDTHLVGGTFGGYGVYYRIRRGNAFKPLLTVDVTDRNGLYNLNITDVPFQSRIYEALSHRRSSDGVGFLADELDAPIDALEQYIVAILDDDKEAIDHWHKKEG